MATNSAASVGKASLALAGWLILVLPSSPEPQLPLPDAAAMSWDSKGNRQGEGREILPWECIPSGLVWLLLVCGLQAEHGHAWCTQVCTYLLLCEQAQVENGAGQNSHTDQEWDRAC